MSSDIFKENLDFLRHKRADLDELLCGLYREAAVSLCESESGELTAEDVSRIYEEIHGNNIKVSPNEDFALFCKEFSLACVERLDLVFADEDAEFGGEVFHPQIAYLKNAFSDKAYKKFAQSFDKVSAAYFPGFREVCEEVYYGRCSHAILPIYSHSDGQLLSFRRLISKYDLKIVCAADIEMSDEAVMRYALLKKGLSGFAGMSGRLCLDFSVVIDGEFGCGDFLVACESLGAVVQSVTSYPQEYSGGSDLLSILLDVTDSDTNALCLFLEGSHIRYTVDGTYTII